MMDSYLDIHDIQRYLDIKRKNFERQEQNWRMSYQSIRRWL